MTQILSLDQQTLRHRLLEVPSSIKPHVKMGFELLSQLSSEVVIAIAEYVASSMKNSRKFQRKEGVALTGLNDNTISDVFTAISFIGVTIVDLEVTADDLVNCAPADLIDSENKALAAQVANVFIADRSAVRAGQEASALARAVLPIFRGIDIEVDLRFAFDDDGQIKSHVPVAVAHIDTDNSKDAFFMQLGSGEIRNLIEKLEKAESRMKSLLSVSVSHG